MAAVRSVFLLLFVFCSLTGPVRTAKVLLMGPSGSHWLNLVYLAEGLIRFRPMASRALGYDTTILELMAEADLFLMRGDFVMHPPHPAMPNMVYIGGYHVQRVNPLPKDLEKFLEESGGVVVLSFGSYAKVMGKEKAEMLAAGLARVPFKVIWKFQGQRPKNTGENTLLMSWIPQNDLLAHPKTLLFITHCGINAVYEAMFHGVPMVRVPAFAEQHGNSDNLETLGTGVTLDIFTMTSDDLYEAIMEVANNKTYKSAVSHGPRRLVDRARHQTWRPAAPQVGRATPQPAAVPPAGRGGAAVRGRGGHGACSLALLSVLLSVLLPSSVREESSHQTEAALMNQKTPSRFGKVTTSVNRQL